MLFLPMDRLSTLWLGGKPTASAGRQIISPMFRCLCWGRFTSTAAGWASAGSGGGWTMLRLSPTLPPRTGAGGKRSGPAALGDAGVSSLPEIRNHRLNVYGLLSGPLRTFPLCLAEATSLLLYGGKLSST